MTKAESTKLLYEKRVREGLCGKCGKHPIAALFSKSRCQICLDTGKDYHRKNRATHCSQKRDYRDRLRKRGLCIHCRNKRDPESHSTWHCTDCSDFLLEYKKLRQRLLLEHDRETYRIVLKRKLKELKEKYGRVRSNPIFAKR